MRGYIKYDDAPASLDSFREATMRAYQIMMTPPFGPAMIMVDGDLAENTMRAKPSASMTYHAPRIAAGDANAVDEIAKLLVGAQNPLILTGRTARTPAAMGLNAARSGA